LVVLLFTFLICAIVVDGDIVNGTGFLLWHEGFGLEVQTIGVHLRSLLEWRGIELINLVLRSKLIK
jgi:hypothetical protein